MKIEVGGLVTFLGAVALVVKVFDWYMTGDEKKRIRERIRLLIERGAVSSASVVKAPLLVLTQVLDAALGASEFSRRALRRSAALSSLLLLACMAVAGMATGTFLGVSEPPWIAYDRELDLLERVAGLGAGEKGTALAAEDREELEQSRKRFRGILDEARRPLWKWTYLVASVVGAAVASVALTMLSLAFSRKVIAELQKAESLLLIIGSLWLGITASIAFFLLVVLVLFTITSGYLLFSGALTSLILNYSTSIGVGVALAYVGLAWLESGAWIKAVALGAIAPMLVMAVTAAASAILYPMRNLVGRAVKNLLERAVLSEKGILAFAATGFTVFAAVIIFATNLLIGGS